MQTLDFPASVQIETTSWCNASCNFCPYPETSQTEPQGVMDDDLFHSIVDQISHYPVQMIQPFLNNDPLMDKRIVPRLETIIRKNPRSLIRLTTNGALMRPEIARALAAMPLETIHISSNGLTAETYKRTMGIDAYSVLRNVNYLWDELRRRGSKTKLVVTAILLAANREEVRHMHDYWRSRGVTFYLNPLNDRAGTLGAQRFVELLPFGAEASRTQLVQYNISNCPALHGFMGILWNGDLITCCMDWTRARVMGNAREASLYTLWHNPRYRAMRQLSEEGRLQEEPLCRDCGDNRFSIDSGVLRDVLVRQGATAELAVIDSIEARRRENPELIQLGLMRN
jgi:MoaA/NifB/PqqE/SkfB family radical SAM enzyme